MIDQVEDTILVVNVANNVEENLGVNNVFLRVLKEINIEHLQIYHLNLVKKVHFLIVNIKVLNEMITDLNDLNKMVDLENLTDFFHDQNSEGNINISGDIFVKLTKMAKINKVNPIVVVKNLENKTN